MSINIRGQIHLKQRFLPRHRGSSGRLVLLPALLAPHSAGATAPGDVEGADLGQGLSLCSFSVQKISKALEQKHWSKHEQTK